MMTPPPTGAGQINCPSCGHPIDWHHDCTEHSISCTCAWTTNDIAWYLLFGELTNAVVPKQRRPMGAWE